MRIPLSKPLFGKEEAKLVQESIESGWVSQGPRVAEFEDLVCTYTGAEHAVATTSCTTALFTALKLLGVGEGDEVIVPSLSFIASANAIVHVGATPVFCEVERGTLNVDCSYVETLITKKTKAVVPVHQLGLPCDLDALRAVAGKHNIAILEDAACALGSLYKGKQIGSSGTACLSFHPRKVIATGEGGMIVTDSNTFATHARVLRNQGMTVDDLTRHSAKQAIIEEYHTIGYNFRMSDVQAAIGVAQMKKLPGILEKRRTLAGIYNEKLADIPWIELPNVPEYADWNYQSYWIALKDDGPYSQKEFMQKLLEKDIATSRGVIAIHREKAYRDLANDISLPVTEKLTNTTVILPLYPQMSETEQLYVLDAVRALV